MSQQGGTLGQAEAGAGCVDQRTFMAGDGRRWAGQFAAHRGRGVLQVVCAGS